MLATLFFLALPSTSHAATVTISASDPSISLTPGWSQQFSQSAQNSFIQTDSFLCELTATLPPSATSVSYVGYKRAGGSAYGYTLDCEDDCILQTANGTDPSVNDDATALQSTIFSINMDPSTQHTLRVYNIPSDASNGASAITFDHLSVLVQDHNPAIIANSTVVSSSITTSSTATSSSAASPTTSAIPASIPDSSTTATSSITTSLMESQASVDVPLTSSSAASIGAPDVFPYALSSTAGAAAPLSSDATAVPSSSDAAAAGTGRSAPSKKNLVIGLTVIALVVVGFVIVGLVIFLRQRRKRRSRNSESSRRTDSFLPIMPPPPPVMRTASPNTISNTFSDSSSMTPAEQPFDSSASSSFVQRQMESRSGSPGSGSAPSIPLPSLPPDTRTRYRMQSRPNSPVSSKNDLWISRTPVKTQFAV